jgi:hypothetical protein
MTLPLFVRDIWLHIAGNFLIPREVCTLAAVCSPLREFVAADGVWDRQLQVLIKREHLTSEEMDWRLKLFPDADSFVSMKQKFFRLQALGGGYQLPDRCAFNSFTHFIIVSRTILTLNFICAQF